jgi:hypothetical protein
MVSFTIGPGRWDPTCYSHPDSAPHFAVGTSPDKSERGFSSGNERTAITLLNRKEFMEGKVKRAGYPIRKTDEFRWIVDLMNMNMEDKVSVKYSEKSHKRVTRVNLQGRLLDHDLRLL